MSLTCHLSIRLVRLAQRSRLKFFTQQFDRSFQCGGRICVRSFQSSSNDHPMLSVSAQGQRRVDRLVEKSSHWLGNNTQQNGRSSNRELIGLLDEWNAWLTTLQTQQKQQEHQPPSEGNGTLASLTDIVKALRSEGLSTTYMWATLTALRACSVLPGDHGTLIWELFHQVRIPWGTLRAENRASWAKQRTDQARVALGACKRQKSSSETTARGILRQLREEEQTVVGDGPGVSLVDTSIYNAVLFCLNGNIDLAQKVVHEMDQHSLPMDAVTYDGIVYNYQVTGNFDAARRTFDQLCEQYSKTKDPKVRPHALTLGRILKLSSDDPDRTLALLDQATALSDASRDFHVDDVVGDPLLPIIDDRCYLLAMQACLGDLEIARSVFSEMIGRYEMGHPELEPSPKHLTVLLTACAQRRSSRAMEQATSILQEMEQLSAAHPESLKVELHRASYNALLNGYLNQDDFSVDTVRMMENIVEQMHELSRSHQHVFPDRVTSSVLMRGWIKAQVPGFPDKVQAAFVQARESKRPEQRPDRAMFVVVLDAWVRSATPEKADQVLADLPGPLDTFCYNIVLKGYAKREMALKASSLLNFLVQKRMADKSSFAAAMQACRTSSRGSQALAVLDLMLRVDGKEGGTQQKLRLVPNDHALTALFVTLSHSSDVEDKALAAERAWLMLRDHRGLGEGCTPAVIDAYVSVCLNPRHWKSPFPTVVNSLLASLGNRTTNRVEARIDAASRLDAVSPIERAELAELLSNRQDGVIV